MSENDKGDDQVIQPTYYDLQDGDKLPTGHEYLLNNVIGMAAGPNSTGKDQLAAAQEVYDLLHGNKGKDEKEKNKPKTAMGDLDFPLPNPSLPNDEYLQKLIAAVRANQQAQKQK